MSYISDNSELLNSMLERTFYSTWREAGNPLYERLELIVTADCNLRCRYCYMARHGHQLCPPKANNGDDIMKHTAFICDWTIRNGFRPSVELFSGSPLSQDICLRVLNVIYDKFKDQPDEVKWKNIIIPTNMSFLLSDEWTDRVKAMLNKFNDIGLPILLSASLEGKYMEDNRPFKFNQNTPGLFLPEGPDDPRDDSYYDKVIQFIKEYNCGIHPMVYSRGIERWKENFLWYQEMFQKYNINWVNMYLLEVRNVEWSEEQIIELCNFIKFLINWTWKKLDTDKERFVRFITDHGFNILKNSMKLNSRGTTCSIQTCMFVRLGDLAIVPCHRLAYDGYEYGSFTEDDNGIINISAKNVELACRIHSYEGSIGAGCQDCIINNICPKQCLGACLETVGDPFTPIPTVCKMQHMKIYTIIEEYKKLGVYDLYCERAAKDVADTLDLLYKLGGKVNG